MVEAERDNPGQSSDSEPSKIPRPAGPEPRRTGSDPPLPSRSSAVRPGRSLFWFPTLVAGTWAAVIAVFVTVTVLFDTEEGASWGDGLGAIVGNFVVAWVIAFVVSAAIRFARRR